jgi:hypothetical protein
MQVCYSFYVAVLSYEEKVILTANWLAHVGPFTVPVGKERTGYDSSTTFKTTTATTNMHTRARKN